MALYCESRQRQSMVRRRSATVWQCFEARRYATARCGRETPGGGRVSTEKKHNARKAKATRGQARRCNGHPKESNVRLWQDESGLCVAEARLGTVKQS